MPEFVKHPIFVLAMIFGSGSMGIFSTFSFYYFQNFLINNMIDFLFIYAGIIFASIIGLVFGLNISNKLARYTIFFSCVVQICSFPVLYSIYPNNQPLTVIFLMIIGFFESFIGLYLIPRANRVKYYSKRLQNNTLLWGFLYLGMLVFSLLFIFNISLAFLFGMITSIIGTFGLYFLIQDDQQNYSNYVRIPIKEIFRVDFLAYLVLFFIYFVFFFSMLSIIAFDLSLARIYHFNSLILLQLPLFLANTIIPLTILYKFNKRFSLKSIFTLTYVVCSISLILFFYSSEYLVLAYVLELWTWSVFSIHIFITIGDSFPGLRNIQPINFWWAVLSLSIGVGILLPILIPNKEVLLPLLLLVLLGSIFLFSYLSSFKSPTKVFFLFIQTKAGKTILEKHFENDLMPELNTELYSGVFTTMNLLLKESFRSDSFLRSIEFENKTLILTESENLYCVIVTDHFDRSLRKNLLEISNLFEVLYYNKLTLLSKEDNSGEFSKLKIENLPDVLKQKILMLQSP